MANEITVSASLRVEKPASSLRLALSLVDQVDMSGTEYIHNIQSIGTSEEAVQVNSDVGSLGWAFFRNLDATNYIKLRPGSGLADMVRINAGECALFRLHTGVTLYAIADTAACRMEYWILET